MQGHFCFSILIPSTSRQMMRTLQYVVRDVHNTPSLAPAGDIIKLLLSSQGNILVTFLSSNKTKLVLNKSSCVHVCAACISYKHMD